MAWHTKYRLEVADYLGVVWKADIQVNQYSAPEIITLKGSGDPINIEFYGDDDPFDQPICGSKLTLNVIAETSFAYSELFTSNNFQFKTLLYHGTTLYWQGYILANTYEEPYDCVPYPIRLTATDGLGLLSEYFFKDLEYTDRTPLATVIFDILSEVGISLFTEYVNINESTMTSSINDSPLTQIGINPDLFKEHTLYDAFAEILKTFNCQIRQDNGKFHIYRICDLAGLYEGTMYGRTFSSGITHSSVTKTPAQYINRTGHASDFRDKEGGVTSIVPQVKTLYANHNYGARESIWKNHDFDFNEFTFASSEWDIEGWTRGSGVSVIPLGTQFPGSGDKGVFINTTNTYTGTKAIGQGIVCLSGGVLVAQIEAAGVTLNGLDNPGKLDIQISNTDGINTKYFDGSVWTDTPTDISLKVSIDTGTAFTPELDFVTYTYYINGIPYTGGLNIILYCGKGDNDVYAAFKSVKFTFINSDHQLLEGVGYTVTNAFLGRVVEREFILGDGPGLSNDPLEYKGVFNTYPAGASFGKTSGLWNSIDDQVPLRPLIEFVAGELGNQYSRQKFLLDIPLLETSANSYFSLVGNLQDTLNKEGSANRIFAPARANYNIKMREWGLTLCEIIIWPKPVIVSVIVPNGNANHCIVTFDIDLDETYTPAAENFTFLESGASWTAGTVTGASISAKVLTLTLGSNATTGTVYLFSYTQPATNLLVSKKGAKVDEIIDHSVTNNA